MEVASNIIRGVERELTRLQEENKELKRQLTFQRENNERRNRELDALHYVWCSGGCSGGVHRYDGQGPDGITQEIVDAAVLNTERLQQWWAGRQRRLHQIAAAADDTEARDEG